MEMVASKSQSNPKEPIMAKGTVVMTMKLKRRDSNCPAITTKTRNTAMAIARKRSVNSSRIFFVLKLSESAISLPRCDSTSRSTSSFVSLFAFSV